MTRDLGTKVGARTEKHSPISNNQDLVASTSGYKSNSEGLARLKISRGSLVVIGTGEVKKQLPLRR